MVNSELRQNKYIMADLNPNMIITLSGNGLNTAIKRQR